jgi:RNA polymerase sigma-70 factor (ECF subfamily)
MQPPSTEPHEEMLAHLADVRRWCLTRSGDPHLADDVAQETVLAALTQLDSLRNPTQLRGWLFRIAQRRLADASRRKPTELPLTVEPQAPVSDPPDEERDLRVAREVRRVLRKLPAFLRRPVRMHYLQERPLREVASRLRTTVNGVKSRLYRARQMLREQGTAR